jgi:hypothetical protein
VLLPIQVNLLVVRKQGINLAGQAKILLGMSRRGQTEPPALVVVSQQALDGVGQGVRRLRRGQLYLSSMGVHQRGVIAVRDKPQAIGRGGVQVGIEGRARLPFFVGSAFLAYY